MRGGFSDDALPRRAVHIDSNLVGLCAGGTEKRVLHPEQLGNLHLQALDVGVFTQAETLRLACRRGHRFNHGVGRTGQYIRAQINSNT